jgi:cytoskeletal protein CcmA (bactofilin family)
VSSGAFALRSTAVVAADVTYVSLVIENGAQIEGRFIKAKA